MLQGVSIAALLALGALKEKRTCSCKQIAKLHASNKNELRKKLGKFNNNLQSENIHFPQEKN